jgi:hypothetical protein
MESWLSARLVHAYSRPFHNIEIGGTVDVFALAFLLLDVPDIIHERGVILQLVKGRDLSWIEAAFLLPGVLQVIADGSVNIERIEGERDDDVALELLAKINSILFEQPDSIIVEQRVDAFETPILSSFFRVILLIQETLDSTTSVETFLNQCIELPVAARFIACIPFLILSPKTTVPLICTLPIPPFTTLPLLIHLVNTSPSEFAHPCLNGLPLLAKDAYAMSTILALCTTLPRYLGVGVLRGVLTREKRVWARVCEVGYRHVFGKVFRDDVGVVGVRVRGVDARKYVPVWVRLVCFLEGVGEKGGITDGQWDALVVGVCRGVKVSVEEGVDVIAVWNVLFGRVVACVKARGVKVGRRVMKELSRVIGMVGKHCVGDKGEVFRNGVLGMHVLYGLGIPLGEVEVADMRTGIEYKQWKESGSVGYLLNALAEFSGSDYAFPSLPAEFLESHVLEYGACRLLTRLVGDESSSMRRVVFKGVDAARASGDDGEVAPKLLVDAVGSFVKGVNRSLDGGGNSKHLPVFALHCRFEDVDVGKRLDYLLSSVVADRSDVLQKFSHVGAWMVFWRNARREGGLMNDIVGGLLDRVFECKSPAAVVNLLHSIAGCLEACVGFDNVESVVEVVVDRILIDYEGDEEDGLFSNCDVASSRIVAVACATCYLYDTDVKRIDAAIGFFKNSLLDAEYGYC